MALNETPSNKQLRFRGDTNRIEDLQPNTDIRRKQLLQPNTMNDTATAAAAAADGGATAAKQTNLGNTSDSPSFFDFFKVEMTRGYILQHDEERYSARRQKIYSFMRIPRDLERFMTYGIMQCADSFLYIHTFLPVRFVLAIWALITRLIAKIFRLGRGGPRLLMPAEICDLLKCSIWILVTLVMLSVDTNRVYHIIKSQSIIKLYIFYNMLEVGDRLLSAFGQDTIDALFWTATEPKDSKRKHFGFFTHMIFTLIYVVLHSVLIMFQATTLNVAVNSNNKGLLTIMISNNFVELKGAVFKKFDKNNLFQLACSDVRERFHLSVLLFIVVIQTMKEFDWSSTQFFIMLPDCASVLFTEILIDWIKHAFITRFNEIPETIYREYTTSLAYDMTQTRQKHAFSDHSDLVARRMGFIPFPLAVVLIKAIYSAVSFHNLAAFLLFLLAYAFVLGLRICLTICALGKACKLMKEHQDERSNSTPSSMTNIQPISSSTTAANMPAAPISTITVTSPSSSEHSLTNRTTVLFSADAAPTARHLDSSHNTLNTSLKFERSTISTSTPKKLGTTQSTMDIELDVTNSLELGATALFSNSDVDLDDVRLNEHVLDTSSTSPLSPTAINGGVGTAVYKEEDFAHSEPDLVTSLSNGNSNSGGSGGNVGVTKSSKIDGSAAAAQNHERGNRLPKRTHKRSESEPSMQSIVGDLSETLPQM